MWQDNVVALDLETTSTNPRSARIVEVALADFSGWEWDTLVDPEMSLPAKITEVTAIRPHDLDGAPKLNEVLPYILSKIHGKAVVAHNGARYDAIVLACESERVGIAAEPIQVIDTLTLGRRVWPKLPDYKLSTIVEHLKISHGRLHGALEDAKCCLEILDAAAKQIGAQSIEDVIEFQEKPRAMGRICDFGRYKGHPWEEIPERYLRWYCFKLESPDPDVVERMKTVLASRAKIPRRK